MLPCQQEMLLLLRFDDVEGGVWNLRKSVAGDVDKIKLAIHVP